MTDNDHYESTCRCATCMNNGWRPIGTAPKDGTEILAWFDGHSVLAVYWRSEGRWVTRGDESYANPAHWQPLPKGPTNE